MYFEYVVLMFQVQSLLNIPSGTERYTKRFVDSIV